MKQVDYKKCAQCGHMFFPSRKNRKYCSRECYLEAHRKPLSPRTCPICKETFMPKRANHKYCSVNCSSKAYYYRRKQTQTPQTRAKKGNPKPEFTNHFRIKNPVAVIEGIEVRFTIHIDHNEPMYFKGSSKKNPNYKTVHDETLWFVQGLKQGNLDLKIIKERGFKVSDILLHNGYEVRDPSEFDRAFKQVIETKL